VRPPKPEPPPPKPEEEAAPETPPPAPERTAEPTPPPAPPPKPAPAPNKRPRWARWFEVGLGGGMFGRNFATDPKTSAFKTGIAGGLRADVTAYPLAFTWKNAYGLFSGVGLGVTFDKPFWQPSTAQAQTTELLPTDELRVEGGLRWKITLYKPMPRPQLHLDIQGGLHQFTFVRGAMDQAVAGVPDTRYVYMSLGGGLTVHFAEWAWIWIRGAYQLITDSGPIQAPDQFGLAAAYGLRFGGGLDFLVWRGIRLGVQGMYERDIIVFGYDPNHRARIADSAVDEYYGALFMLGYVL
jgi:hypothetical protein